MTWFKAGDLVKINEFNPQGLFHKPQHPNKQRELREGDRFIVEKSQFFSGYIQIGYTAWNKEFFWFDSKNAEYFLKGDIEDCLKFLQRTNRSPVNMAPNKWAWGEMTDFGSYSRARVDRKDFLPHYLFRHLPPFNRKVSNDLIGGECYRYSTSQEEAFKNACEAWLKMTPSQQLFLNNVTYLEEIYP